MKKIIFTIGCTIALASNGFSQGTVNWNDPGVSFVANTNGTQYSILFGGGPTGSGTEGKMDVTALFYFALLVNSSTASSPTNVSQLAAWQQTGLTATNNTSTAGRISVVNPATAAVANNWPVGSSNSLIMVGWSANLGSSFTAVLNALQNWNSEFIPNAYFGISSMGLLQAVAGDPGIAVLGGLDGQINNSDDAPMQLDLLAQQVPEPGMTALAILGGASLLLLRRRK